MRFSVYPNDHPPCHVHAATGGIAVIIELLPNGTIELADRKDCILPHNAKRSDVRKILDKADIHLEELIVLWEKRHGKP